MEKKIVSRVIIVVAIIAVSIICFFLFHRKKDNNFQKKSLLINDKTDVAFVGNNINITDVEGTIQSYTQRNGKIYIMTKKSSEAEKSDCYCIYSMSTEKCIVQKMIEFDEDGVNAFCVDDNDNYIYIAEKDVDDKHVIELVKIDDGGNEEARIGLKEITGKTEVYLCKLLADKSGQVVLACRDRIYFLDETLQIICKIEPKQDFLVDIALAKSGRLVCVTDQVNSQEMFLKVSLLNQEKKWEEDIDINLDATLSADYIISGLDYDFYYKGDDGIYGYDITSKENKEIIDYNSSYMTNIDSDGMTYMGDGVFVGKNEYFTDDNTQISLVLYKKKTKENVNKKQIITFGTIYPGNNVKSAVAKFNRSNSEYEIEIVDYSEMDPARLRADFASGKGQDIIDMNAFPLSVEQCISKGMLENLYPYFEQDDELGLNDLLSPVRDAMKYDDKIYYLTPGFLIETIAVKKDSIGENFGWSIEDLKQFVNDNDRKSDLFESKYYDKEVCLDNFISGNLSDYIDWKTGKCSFDSDEFKYILWLCNEKGVDSVENVSDNDLNEEFDSRYSRFQNGDFLLLEEDEIDLQAIQFERKALDSSLAYVGFPNEEKRGSAFEFCNKFAISSQSNHKKEAWEFIRTFLMKDYQGKTLGECYMPVTKVMFEEKLKEYAATEPYVNVFGEEVEPIENYDVKYGGVSAEMGVPTQEDIDIYMELINNTKRCKDRDCVIEDIIMEEVQPYFKGRKRIDETVDIIQKRVTTYINEQR